MPVLGQSLMENLDVIWKRELHGNLVPGWYMHDST